MLQAWQLSLAAGKRLGKQSFCKAWRTSEGKHASAWGKGGPLQYSNRDLRRNVFFLFFFFFFILFWCKSDALWACCQAKEKGWGGVREGGSRAKMCEGYPHPHRSSSSFLTPLDLLGSIRYYGLSNSHESRWLCEDRILTDAAPPEVWRTVICTRPLSKLQMT